MDKIKELLQDQNNKIIAIAILVVLILAIGATVFFLTRNSSSSSQSATASNTPGMPSDGPNPPGMPAGGPTTPGIPPTAGPMGPAAGPMGPNSMPNPGVPGMDAGLNPMDEQGAEAPVQTASLKGKPMEAGRIDPFAPIGVKKASKTKTYGDTITARMQREGVTWAIPTTISAVSFTDYKPGETKIGYIKTAADIKREKDKADAKKKADQKEQEKAINAILYAKPANIRLASIMKGMKGSIASFEVNFNGRTDYKSLEVGEKFVYGYSGYTPLEAEVKSIGSDSAVLKVVGKDVDWKYNVTDSNSRGQFGQGMQGPNYGMPNTPTMPGGIGGMNPGMPDGIGGMNPGMPGGIGGMNPGIGGGLGTMGGSTFGGGMGMNSGMGPMGGNMPGMNSGMPAGIRDMF